MNKNTKIDPNSNTQSFLPISEIRQNTIVLKNGGLRAILKTNSINFNLKAEDEQTAIVMSYQGFLNSLEFPIQILIKSRKLDLDNYIQQVKTIANKQENKLLKEQTLEYSTYIQKLIDYADIMEKSFYVIVSYDPGRSQGVSHLTNFFQKLAPKDSITDIFKKHKEFDSLRKKLQQRTNTVTSGLENCGLKVETLKTKEIIKLLYESYNPQSSRTVKIKDLDQTSIQTDEERIEENKTLENNA